MKIRRQHPFITLFIWTIITFVISFLWYGSAINRENKESLIKKQEVLKQKSDEAAYMELLSMPEESEFETIRVILVNKEDNSIFYNLQDFESVRSKITAGKYRGKVFYIRAKDKKDKFVVVNELPLESYLYGVVPSEMPSGYPMEALKAQAVCARTYAVLHMMNPAYPEYNAHVDDTTSYQVYHNIEEQEKTNRAVDETRGQLLFQEDGKSLAETLYYSTSCGLVVEASTNSTFETYISAVNKNDFEANESWYRWTYHVKKLDKEGMLNRLISRQKATEGKILTMTGKDVYEELPIRELETVKELFISKRSDSGMGEEMIIHTNKNVYKVLGEYNIRYVLNEPSVPVTKQDGNQIKMKTLLPSAYILLQPIKQNNIVTGYEILGGGYGHGIGMSQNGAKAMANQGYTMEEILEFYYPGSQILTNV